MRYAIVPVTPFEQNCTIFWCEKTRQAAVIDPGGDIERVLDVLERGGADAWRRYSSPTAISTMPAAWPRWPSAPACRSRGRTRKTVSGSRACRSRARCSAFPSVLELRARPLAEGRRQGPFRRDRARRPALPRATRRAMVFFHQPSRLAQVGDVLFQGSIGRTDFPRGDYDTLIRSIKERLFPLGDDVEIHLRPRPDVHLRRRTALQPVPERPLRLTVRRRCCG